MAYPRIQQPYLTPEEEESLLSQLGNSALGGLSLVGTVLDTPGAFVRTALAGENPFASIFDPSQRVEGRDLLEQWGLLDANQEGFHPLDDPGDAMGDVAGFGAEVLLDPLTYLTLGASALTKPGQAAAKAGALAKASYGAGGALEMGAREAGIRAGQRGLVGLGLPFMEPLAVLGTGETAAKVAGGLDTAGDFLRYGNPIGRTAGALFDATMLGTNSRTGQTAAPEVFDAARAAEASARESLIPHIRVLQDAGLMGEDYATNQLLRSALEGTSPLPAQYANLQPSISAIRSGLDSLLTEQQALGLPVQALQEPFADYVPRQLTNFAKDKGVRQKVYQTADRFGEQREDILRNIPGGTAKLNELSIDPFFSGPSRTAADNAAAAQELFTNHGIVDKPEELADYLWKLDPQHLESVAAGSPVPMFGNHPLQDILSRQTAGQKSIAAVNGVYDLLGKNTMTNAPGAIPIEDVLKKAGLQDANGNLTPGAIGQLQSRGLAGQFVPAEISDDVARIIKGFSAPDEANAVLRFIDKATNLFKAGVTTWPSFHVRNLYSGQFMNWVGGVFSPTSYMDAHNVLTKADHVISGAEKLFPGLSPEEATRKILDQAFSHKVLDRHAGAASDIIGPTKTGTGLLSEIPGTTPLPSIIETLKSAVPGSLEEANPLNIRGVLANEDIFSPVKSSRTAGYYVEGVNRLAPFIEAMKQGYSPQSAAAKVRAMQVDYTKLSTFEKSVMRRLVPFYSFLRGAAPEVVGDLMQRPGGKTAQYVRLTNEARSEPDAFLPEHLQGGLAIPLGAEENGSQSFLTQIDMPVEAVFAPLRTGPNSIAETGRNLLGNLSPYIKGPLETMTGRQFFTGRDMRDLYSPTGFPVIDQLAANSPLSKVSSIANQLKQGVEGRKSIDELAINLLTGARVSDVDMDKMRSIQQRELLEDYLRGQPGAYMFEHLAIPEEKLAQLPPDMQQAYLEYKALSSRAQKDAREKKKRIGVRQ